MVGQIADHTIETYKLQEGPIVLMWRETMNGFYLGLNPNSPTWDRDTKAVHDHWKRYGPGVVKLLEKRGLTVVRVNSMIRDLVGHRKQPDLDKRKNESSYRACLPSSKQKGMTMGIVVFPRDTQTDHPLIRTSRDRRCKAGAHSAVNAVTKTRDAHGLGNLSTGVKDEIIDGAHSIVQEGFEADTRYPLFRDKEPPSLPLAGPK